MPRISCDARTATRAELKALESAFQKASKVRLGEALMHAERQKGTKGSKAAAAFVRFRAELLKTQLAALA